MYVWIKKLSCECVSWDKKRFGAFCVDVLNEWSLLNLYWGKLLSPWQYWKEYGDSSEWYISVHRGSLGSAHVFTTQKWGIPLIILWANVNRSAKNCGNCGFDHN